MVLGGVMAGCRMPDSNDCAASSASNSCRSGMFYCISVTNERRY